MAGRREEGRRTCGGLRLAAPARAEHTDERRDRAGCGHSGPQLVVQSQILQRPCQIQTKYQTFIIIHLLKITSCQLRFDDDPSLPLYIL
jgi:hypothetical protein